MGNPMQTLESHDTGSLAICRALPGAKPKQRRCYTQEIPLDGESLKGSNSLLVQCKGHPVTLCNIFFFSDPFSTKKNIASSMSNTLIYEYFESCLRKAYEYFAMPRDKHGNVSISLTALRELAKKKTDSLLQVG
jgi:hypothetical protein